MNCILETAVNWILETVKVNWILETVVNWILETVVN